MALKEYISKIDNIYRSGEATEYSYRPALESYMETIAGSGLSVIHEPKHLKECGAPDFVVNHSGNGAPAFYIETKPVGNGDLDGRKRTGNKEQFDRYKRALRLVVFTDFLDFHFYEDGQWLQNIRLGEPQGDGIAALPENEERLRSLIAHWGEAKPQPIKSAARLAEIMAGKARLLRHATEKAMGLAAAGGDEPTGQLPQLFNAFKSWLLQDLTPEGFADIYAQTIVYGLFAACLNNPGHTVFTRQSAANLIPKSNPFLRRIFHEVAFDLDRRVEWIVDDLAAAFAATDITKVMGDYGKNSWENDPMVHFYEDFLAEYDPKLRKDLGVWYTPQPVVGFIVRSVDATLRRDFGLPDGLADSGRAAPKGAKGKPAHRVQILDPAAGTGTFLAQAILQIHDTIARKNAGLWQQYVESDLKPRLNGFELMMAPYTIAHIKLDTTLRDTGYTPVGDRRLNLFLTNALEAPSPNQRTLFNALTVEADEADRVKREKPVMVLIGNPPYNGSSKNKGKWIMSLMDDYKKEPGGEARLNERNYKWINDDYVKFLRLAQYYTDKNRQGIVGFITPHGFIDNPTFRGMRWSLLRSFNDIYILNLHGNSRKKESTPDGGADENVFSIMQGVSISILVNTGKRNTGKLGRVFYAELYGKRAAKLDFLQSHSIVDTEYVEVKPQPPMFFFYPKGQEGNEYEKGFKADELFRTSSMGITTAKDDIVVCDNEEDALALVKNIMTLPVEDIKTKYHIIKETPNWTVANVKNDLTKNRPSIKRYCYRPFDTKYIPYTGASNGIICRPRYNQQRNLLNGDNTALCLLKFGRNYNFSIFVTDGLTDKTILSSKYNAIVFPLYTYGDKLEEGGTLGIEKTPNFNGEIYGRICDGLGREPQPEEVFCYIYAVLHSQRYRERYAELLKSDFPRVPYPTDSTLFGKLAELGQKLVNLHLMRGADKWQCEAGFPEAGSNEVETVEYSEGRVMINASQFFAPVSEEAWDLHIGGYQPAQKWLKDRRGRKLSYPDCIHYERIIHALSGTACIMREIDGLQFPT